MAGGNRGNRQETCLRPAARPAPGGLSQGSRRTQGTLWRPKVGSELGGSVSSPPGAARRRHRPPSIHCSGFPLASVGNRNYEIFYSFLRSASGAIGGLA